MANICLTIGTKAPADKMMAALNTIDGLNNWWTSDTSGDTVIGGIIIFRFGENGGMDMRVQESNPQKVTWECMTGPDEWVGTKLHFLVEENEGHAQLMFKHEGWAAETSFHHHCSMKWAVFLLSLKQYLDTGEGRAFPNDIQIAA